MENIYVLRGRSEAKTLRDEALDPLDSTFAEVYTEVDAAMQALRAHLHHVSWPFLEENCFVDAANLNTEHFQADTYGWYFHVYDAPTEEFPLVAEWVMTVAEGAACDTPVLPYFCIELCRTN